MSRLADRARSPERARLGDRRQRIDHHAVRSIFADQRPDLQQVFFGADAFGASRIQPQQARLDVRLELDADRREIAHDLFCALVEAHEQRALAAPAGGLDELARQRGLGGAGHARDQRAAAAKHAAAQHRVEPVEAGAEPLASKPRAEWSVVRRRRPPCPMRPEAHRKLAGRETRAAVLRDLEPVAPRCRLPGVARTAPRNRP